MSKQVNLDDVFRSGLNSHQEPFDEGAWLHMQQKLTADAVKPKFWLAYLNKKTINILLTMFLFTASVTAAFLLQANTRILPIQPASSQIITDNNTLINLVNYTPTSSRVKQNTTNTNANTASSNTTIHYSHANVPPVVKKSASAVNTTPAAPAIAASSHTTVTKAPEKIIAATTAVATYKVIAYTLNSPSMKLKSKKPKIKNSFKPSQVLYHSSRSDHYDCATLGIHYVFLQPSSNFAGTGQKPGGGIDLEAYTKNFTSGRYYGLFLGVGTSVAWNGKSKKTDITLSTPASDPGVTFLQNVHADFNLMAKVELGTGNLKFYAIGFTGWRGAFISQEIQSKKPIDGFENTSKNVWSQSMWQWGGGAGVRYHFAEGISLDIRGMYHDADFMKMANVQNANYDMYSGKYSLSYKVVQPQQLSIHIGFLFCLSEMDSYSGPGYRNQPTFRSGVNIPMPAGGGGMRTPVQIKLPTPKVGN